MNSSSSTYNVSSLFIADSASAAAVKNVIVLAVGIIINYINATLIHTFRKHQIFVTNPRYILFIHLVVNDMIQLTMSISMFVISYVFFHVNVFLCCLLLIFAIFTTLNTPINLAVMAVECYIAVCFPLRHAELCTVKRTYILIGCIWALSSIAVIPEFLFLLATQPLMVFYSTTYCVAAQVLYRNPVSSQKREVTYMICFSGVWLTLLCTYFKIFFAARAANSADGNKKKARNTILLHGFQLLLCMLTYLDPVALRLFMLIPKYFYHMNFVWYVVVHILPRLVSPILYGLRDKTFKQYLKKYLLCTTRADIKPH